MDWLTLIVILLLAAALVHSVIEVVYFIRVAICYVLARFVKKKIHILEKCAIGGEIVSSCRKIHFVKVQSFQEFARPKMSTWFSPT